jgi:hypothetical protein
MFTALNSLAKGSGVPTHCVGDLMQTMGDFRVSRGRTELLHFFVIPSPQPHPVTTRSLFSGPLRTAAHCDRVSETMRLWKAQEALEIFRLLREANLRMFARLAPEQWQRHGVHAERCKLTLQDAAERQLWTDLAIDMLSAKAASAVCGVPSLV